MTQFTTETNFDVLDPNNELYKYNSTEGGAIMPRGTSIIGLDLHSAGLFLTFGTSFGGKTTKGDEAFRLMLDGDYIKAATKFKFTINFQCNFK